MRLLKSVWDHYTADSFMCSFINSIMSKIRQQIVIEKEQKKFKCLLLTLFPRGIIIKFPISSETPKNIPLIYMLDNPIL